MSKNIHSLFLTALLIWDSLSLAFWFYLGYVISQIDISYQEKMLNWMLVGASIFWLGITLLYSVVWNNRYLRRLSDGANAVAILAGLYYLSTADIAEDVIIGIVFLVASILYFSRQYFRLKE